MAPQNDQDSPDLRHPYFGCTWKKCTSVFSFRKAWTDHEEATHNRIYWCTTRNCGRHFESEGAYYKHCWRTKHAYSEIENERVEESRESGRERMGLVVVGEGKEARFDSIWRQVRLEVPEGFGEEGGTAETAISVQDEKEEGKVKQLYRPDGKHIIVELEVPDGFDEWSRTQPTRKL